MPPLKLIIFAIISSMLVTVSVIPFTNSFFSDENTLDVIILDGQSNAAYYPTVPERSNAEDVDLPAPSHKLLYYGTDSSINTWGYRSSDHALYEFYQDGSWKVGGEEPYLSYYYSERTGRDVLTINVARGAMSITWLQPEGEGGQYAAECIEEALGLASQEYTHINLVGWVMIQGEHDKNMSVSTYQANFLKLANYYTGIGVLDCYIVHTRYDYGINATTAQEQLASQYDHIHMATMITDTFTEENGLLVEGNPIHYSQLGRNAIGKELAEYIPVEEFGSWNGADVLIQVIPLIMLVGIALTVVRNFIVNRD